MAPAPTPSLPLPPGIAVRDHPTCGPSAYATRAFAAGEVVIAEAPLLLVDSAADKLVPRLLTLVKKQLAAAARAGQAPAIELDDEQWKGQCARLLAFARAPAAAQALVLGRLQCAPPPAELEHTSVARMTAAAAEAFAHAAAQIVSAIKGDVASKAAVGGNLAGVQELLGDAATVRGALLAFALNAHVLSDTAIALYAAGAKLAHTCGSPSVQYAHGGDGQGYWVAARDIGEGELLTTQYVYGKQLLLLPTATRQQEIADLLGFTCGCDRCAAPVDDMRQLPCPVCAPASQLRGPDGKLPEEVVAGAAAGRPGGALQYQTHAGRWACSGCGAGVEDADAALFGGAWEALVEELGGEAGMRIEEVVQANVFDFDRQLDANPYADVRQLSDLISRVGAVVGPDHWSFNYLLTVRSEMMMGYLRAPVVMGAMAWLMQGGDVEDIKTAVESIQSDWQQVWRWAAVRTKQQPPNLLGDALLSTACDLLNLGAELYPVLSQANQPLLDRVQQVAEQLLKRLGPQLRTYDACRLPKAHPTAAAVSESRAAFRLAAEQPPGSYEEQEGGMNEMLAALMGVSGGQEGMEAALAAAQAAGPGGAGRSQMDAHMLNVMAAAAGMGGKGGAGAGAEGAANTAAQAPAKGLGGALPARSKKAGGQPAAAGAAAGGAVGEEQLASALPPQPKAGGGKKGSSGGAKRK